MPGPKDPARARGPFAAGLRRLGRVGGDRRRAAKAHEALVRATERLLKRAQGIFHPARGRVRRRAAQAFLRRYVLRPGAPLRIADEALAPRRSVSVATAWAACRAGRLDEALALALSRSRDTPALARFAALLLLERGDRDEAAALVPRMGRGGFLGAWLRGELATSPEARRAAHGEARRRATTPAQGAAVRAQARRYGLSDGLSGPGEGP